MVDSAGKRRLLFGCHHAESALVFKEVEVVYSPLGHGIKHFFNARLCCIGSHDEAEL